MPWSVAVPAIASTVGAGLGFLGQRNAQQDQQRQSDAALEFAKEQAAQQQQNFDRQQAMLQSQWEARQAALAPFRAAASGILAKYGLAPIQAPQEPATFAPQSTMANAAPSSLTLAQLGAIAPVTAAARTPLPSVGPAGLSLADLGFAGPGQLIGGA